MLPQSLIVLALTVFASAAPLSRRALDLGSCSDPTVKFANGLDGRTEPAFEPNNEADFNHGSALNIGVISSFICGQLQSKCKASQQAVDACNSGAQAASSLTGQAAADAFNNAVTGGAGSAPVVSQSAAAPVASSTAVASSGSDCPGTVTVTAGAAPTATEAAPAPPAASPTGASSSSSGANLQTFTGSLGGAPPAVTAGGKGFVTDGSDFVNVAAALGRSCDVQHNACANAANSGSGSFSVSDCDTQDTACKAAAGN